MRTYLEIEDNQRYQWWKKKLHSSFSIIRNDISFSAKIISQHNLLSKKLSKWYKEMYQSVYPSDVVKNKKKTFLVHTFWYSKVVHVRSSESEKYVYQSSISSICFCFCCNASWLFPSRIICCSFIVNYYYHQHSYQLFSNIN